MGARGRVVRKNTVRRVLELRCQNKHSCGYGLQAVARFEAGAEFQSPQVNTGKPEPCPPKRPRPPSLRSGSPRPHTGGGEPLPPETCGALSGAPHEALTQVALVLLARCFAWREALRSSSRQWPETIRVGARSGLWRSSSVRQAGGRRGSRIARAGAYLLVRTSGGGALTLVGRSH
jgi:hypothetical protein